MEEELRTEKFGITALEREKIKKLLGYDNGNKSLSLAGGFTIEALNLREGKTSDNTKSEGDEGIKENATRTERGGEKINYGFPKIFTEVIKEKSRWHGIFMAIAT